MLAEALFQNLIREAWVLLLCGPVLVTAVAATVYAVRRRACTVPSGQAGQSDQLFWDLFLGAAVAVPALLIPALVSPWAGLLLAAAGIAAGVASFRGTPRLLARREQREADRALQAAHLAARMRHDELLDRWRRYELDPACCIDYPALTDVRLPETSALIKAMCAADQLRRVSHHGYPDAVTTLAASLAAAERAAGIPAEQA